MGHCYMVKHAYGLGLLSTNILCSVMSPWSWHVDINLAILLQGRQRGLETGVQLHDAHIPKVLIQSAGRLFRSKSLCIWFLYWYWHRQPFQKALAIYWMCKCCLVRYTRLGLNYLLLLSCLWVYNPQTEIPITFIIVCGFIILSKAVSVTLQSDALILRFWEDLAFVGLR